MRILILSYDFDDLGGSGTTLRAVASDLEQHGHIVLAATSMPKFDEVIAFRPDAVISQQRATPEAASLAEEIGAAFVMFVHGPNQYETFKPKCDLIVFNSREQRRLAKSAIGDTPSCVLHPPVFQDEYATDGNGTCITLIGATVEKGFWTVHGLALKFPEENFLIVGTPPSRSKKDPENLEIIKRTAMPRKVYARTKLLLMPSLWESYGRVAVEAAVSGIPTIAHDLPGIREATMDRAIFVPLGASWEEPVRQALSDLKELQKRALGIVDDSACDCLDEFKLHLSNAVSSHNSRPVKLKSVGVSVIIATDGTHDVSMADSVESVISQKNVDLELIIVDGGVRMNLPYVSAFGQTVVKLPRNSGLDAAKQTGQRLATKPYVIFHEADDVMLPGSLRRRVDGLVNERARLAEMVASMRNSLPATPVAPVVQPKPDPVTKPKPVTGRRPRVGIVTPWLDRYGLDQWVSALVVGLSVHSDQVELVGVAVTGPNVSQATIDRVSSFTTVTRGAGSFGMLARECDVVIVSSMPKWTELLPGGMPPACCRIVLVSHCAAEQYQSDIAMADRAAGIVAVSKAALDGVPPDLRSRTRVIHSGIDLRRIDSWSSSDHGRIRAQWGVPIDAKVLGYIGRISADKSVLTLSDTVACLPTSWWGVAIGPDHGSLKQELINRGDGRVVVPGPTDEIGATLRSFDALLVPAQREGFGLATVEGWASGTPVLARHTGIAAEHLDLILSIGEHADGEKVARSIMDDVFGDSRTNKASARSRELFSAEAFGKRWADYVKELVRS